MREVLHQDVHVIGCAVQALELLSGQDGPMGLDERVGRVADHHAEVLQARATAYAANPCPSRRRRGERLQAVAAKCLLMHVHAFSNDV
jgi:hypothetical protein